jgi:hypothetical protein
MKKKIITDIIMFITMILLMYLSFTGIVIHEILGIGVFILFFIHKAFNFKWIKAITKSMVDGNNINKSVKWKYILDVLLLIDIILITISGIFISQILFVNLIRVSFNWSDLHHFFSAVGFLLIILHILLHFKELSIMFKKKLSNENKVKKIGYYLLLIILIGLPIKVIFNKVFINYLTKPFIKDKAESINNITNTSTNNKITLEEYLKDLHCNGCSRHCPLLALRCSRGQAYLEQAKTAYYNEYSYNMNIGEYNITLS